MYNHFEKQLTSALYSFSVTDTTNTMKTKNIHVYIIGKCITCLAQAHNTTVGTGFELDTFHSQSDAVSLHHSASTHFLFSF